jgi:isocitrate dehydrogenase (NAD+)
MGDQASLPPVVHHVTLIPGDGIGPEVVEAARRALEATGVMFDWDRRDAGADAFRRRGVPLGDDVVESIRERRVALKGPTGTTGSGFRAVSVALRVALDLHTGIRPCRAYPGIRAPFPGTDLVVVRMTHEDLYAGIEFAAGDPATVRLRDLVLETRGVALGADSGVSLKPLSEAAVARVAGRAFEYAAANGRKRVTIAHKATVMRATDGLFLGVAREIGAAHPGLVVDDMLVDTLCHHLVTRPHEFDVLLMPVQYGDLLSDLAAGLVGGLGVAPGMNLGDDCAVFEAVHGTAMKHAGTGRANPMAMMLSGVLLLRHIGEQVAADRLETAVAAVIAAGTHVTYDLLPPDRRAGAETTEGVADAVIEELGHPAA